MQTRKRAKSVTFGKATKPKTVTEPVKEEKVVSAPPPAVVKVEVVEAKPEKVVESEAAKKVSQAEPILSTTPELSSTPVQAPIEPAVIEKNEPPEEKNKVESSSIVTPPSEFITDASPTSSEPAVVEEIKPLSVDPIEPVAPPAADDSLSPAPGTEVKPEVSESSGELSATPPPSAFTIQGNSVEAETPVNEKKKHFVLYFLVIALIAFTLGLGAMAAVTYGFITIPGVQKMAFTPKSNPFAKAQPTTAPTAAAPEPTVTPTAKPADLKAYTISVLNGSGVKGKAAEVKTSLTTAGFKVGTSGNADRSDYTTTQVTAKKTVDKAYLAQLETELKKSYKLDQITTIPATASGADVVITLGKTAAQ